MTGLTAIHNQALAPTISSSTPLTDAKEKRSQMVKIVALAALTAIITAIAATLGLLLSGVAACVIAVLSTALLITTAILVYKILKPNENRPVGPPVSLIPKSFNTIPKINCEQAKSLEVLGVVDPYMIVSHIEDAPLFFVVHRPNGNVALITHGLWNPKNPSEGMELLVEFPKSQFADLDYCGIYQAFLNVACSVKRQNALYLNLLKSNLLTVTTYNVKALPVEFVSRNNSISLLGIDSSSLPNCPVPKYFNGPNNVQIPLVTMKLLTIQEASETQPYNSGKKGLAASFKRNGTHHISFQSPKSISKIPPPVNSKWTVQELRSRVEQFKLSASPNILDPLETLCDVIDYTPPVTPNVLFNLFEKNEMASNLLAITNESMISFALNSSTHKLQKESAKNITTLLETHSNLYMWNLAADFIYNPEELLRRCGSNFILPTTLPPPVDLSLRTAIAKLANKGTELVTKYIQRVEWIGEVFKREKIPFDPRFCLEILGTDEPLMSQTKAFLREHADIIEELLTKNPERYNLFLHFRKNPTFLHNLNLRQAIERGGFSIASKAIKHDTCICRTCKVEVSGWRPWMDPEKLHDLSKHVKKMVK